MTSTSPTGPATLPTAEDLQAAAQVVYASLTPTPALRCPLLSRRLGADVVVKHENHLPTGAFKVRGGLVYLDRLKAEHPDCPGIIGATRGNHGQSLAFAAGRAGIPCTIVAPKGNSPGKNAAMAAYGATLIEHGDDFQASLEYASALADDRGLAFVPSFHPALVAGVASYGTELFTAAPDLEAVVVPIGLGSGIVGLMAARAALGRDLPIYGVVAEQAAAYALTFKAGHPVETDTANTIADGMACRTPNPQAAALICAHAADILTVSEAQITAAMGHILTDTHNLAEGAGAAAVAAVAAYPDLFAGKRVGVVLSGGNVDTNVLKSLL